MMKWAWRKTHERIFKTLSSEIIEIKGEKRKTPLFITDKNDALTFAENDIKDNCELYRQRFLKESKRYGLKNGGNGIE